MGYVFGMAMMNKTEDLITQNYLSDESYFHVEFLQHIKTRNGIGGQLVREDWTDLGKKLCDGDFDQFI